MPWGRAGYAKWGLSVSEADTFRAIMFVRQRAGIPLFFYDRNRRSWFPNLADYPEGSAILRQWGEWEITLQEYRAVRGG